jgi:hypothetical protein
MSKADINEENNAEVLRANDIIPPYNPKNSHEQITPSKEHKPHNVAEKAKNTEPVSTEPENAAPHKTVIPKFDLARQIMSEQRKAVSIKRISPDKKEKTENHKHKIRPINHVVKPLPMLQYQEQIITEIVQRDIQKLKMRQYL